MDLREFVSITLQQIVSSVEDAQSESSEGLVNPNIWKAQRDNAAKLNILESTPGSGST